MNDEKTETSKMLEEHNKWLCEYLLNGPKTEQGE